MSFHLDENELRYREARNELHEAEERVELAASRKDPLVLLSATQAISEATAKLRKLGWEWRDGRVYGTTREDQTALAVLEQMNTENTGDDE